MTLRAYTHVNGTTGEADSSGRSGPEERYRYADTLLQDTMKSRRILVMPALCIGNVGQLAIDLLLEACKKDSKHVAVLKHPTVLPCYGPNPFHDGSSEAKGIESHAAHPLDLYQVGESDKVCLLVMQQRAPAAAGCQTSFGKDLMQWLSGRVDEIWVLGSLDASFRHDDDISRQVGTVLRSVPSDESNRSCIALADVCTSHGIPPLYGGGPSDAWYRKVAEDNSVHMPWALLSSAKDANIPSVGLISFVVEGDNRVDGHAMAKKILTLFGQEDMGIDQESHKTDQMNLQEPFSWRGSL